MQQRSADGLNAGDHWWSATGNSDTGGTWREISQAFIESSRIGHTPATGVIQYRLMKATEPAGLLQRIHLIDLTAFGWCHRRGTTSAVFPLARGISRTADGWLYAMLPLLCLVSGADAGLRLVTLSCYAFLGERALYFAMKNTCRRRRPPEVLPGFESLVIASDRFSFPSGHTSAAFLFAGICSSEFGAWAALLLYPWAGCVGVSRVLLGVHFPSDIVAGAALGSCILLFSRMVLAA